MRYLILSDIHSNDEALKAVVRRVRRKRFDTVVCLGDFVGYGAQPNQVLERLRAMPARRVVVRGNHDRVAITTDGDEQFNAMARAAVSWTRAQLSRRNRRFLEDLPVGPVSDGDVSFCHGSPIDEDEYVFNEYAAYRVFQHHSARIVFYGHTHLPMICCLEGPQEVSVRLIPGPERVRLDPSKRYLINPGSVGQPRDRNPEASCLLFDRENHAVQFLRIAYDVDRAADLIRRAGLPPLLANRLSAGV